ncbi:BMP family ABC transporter substrate-binding protein [Maridesulfovibrio sp.]|uniref:BMP family ABC transporter substrate-binding protein n=1 Tax=Maridesulfovibrio sp. TaxID=2795000 RepID=UPI0029CA97DE|nr:BMP family ABC transporter substrate-binding protein [Maridesulfovibrio sp.]
MRKVLLMAIVAAMSVMLASVAFAGAKKDKVKVGFVYISPVGDEGYSYAQDQGRKAIDALPWVETSFVESVAEGPDSERVMLNFARKGYDMVIGTSFGYMDPMVKVSKKFPKTAFMHCSGFKSTPNMSNYFGRMYQARYLTGIVAGMMTKSNVIGYVAAFPIPEVIRGINAFTLGVRSVNPKATVRVVWTKTWYDPALEKDAAISLLDMKADVITQHQDSPGPQEAAQERGKYSIAYNSDMSNMAPKSHLTAAIWNWAPLFKNAVEQLRDGVWQGDESLWWGMDQGVVDIAPFGPMVPQNVKDKVAAVKQDIIDGKNVIFAGPLKDQNGKVIVPAGKSMTDPEMLGMMWFVDGVIGNTK